MGECAYAFVMSRWSLIGDLEDCEEVLADLVPGERKVGEQQSLLFLLSQCESLDPLRSAERCEYQDHAIRLRFQTSVLSLDPFVCVFLPSSAKRNPECAPRIVSAESADVAGTLREFGGIRQEGRARGASAAVLR